MNASGPRRHGCLEFEGVGKVFEHTSRGSGTLEVLAGIDLSVGPDESVGLIGPNGAGKSTLLKLAAGVSPPSRGVIRRTGRMCSVIELGSAVHPDLTGAENVELLASLYGIPRRRLPGLLDTIVEFAELQHAIDWPTRKYSTGMVARLAFATAAYSDPDLLLIDEVLSVGDLPFQFRCRERVEELRREGTTVVLVSHDLELVAAVCDRVALLRNASIEADGPATAVITRYLGLPESGDDADAVVSIAAERSRVAVGEPMGFTITLSGQDPATVDVDLVIPKHPTLAAHGIDRSVICANERVLVETASSSFQIPTAHLPPGRYELHARVGPPGDASYAAPATITLTGERPERYTAQLNVHLDVSPSTGRVPT